MVNIWLVVTGTMKFYDFPIILGMENHPKWRTPSFFRGVGWNRQPEKMSIRLKLICETKHDMLTDFSSFPPYGHLSGPSPFAETRYGFSVRFFP